MVGVRHVLEGADVSCTKGKNFLVVLASVMGGPPAGVSWPGRVTVSDVYPTFSLWE